MRKASSNCSAGIACGHAVLIDLTDCETMSSGLKALNCGALRSAPYCSTVQLCSVHVRYFKVARNVAMRAANNFDSLCGRPVLINCASIACVHAYALAVSLPTRRVPCIRTYRIDLTDCETSGLNCRALRSVPYNARLNLK